MHLTKLAVAGSLILLASGCAGTGQYGPNARAIDYDEASSFERSLQAEKTTVPQLPQLLYTQPVNKKEACKLPTTQDQLERTNFKAYWDGQCKDGYAFGLGRDIAISDTHHVEEITKYNGPDSYMNENSRVGYDFVNYQFYWRTPAGKWPAGSYLQQSVSDKGNDFLVLYTLGYTDELGNNYLTQSSPLKSQRYFRNDQKNVVFTFKDFSAQPAANESAVRFLSEIVNPKTNVSVIAVVKYANGQVRHAKITNGVTESVELPAAYLNNLFEKLEVIKTRLAEAQKGVDIARQMEREYLYLACNGKHVIEGLDNKTATKICTWRDQFKVAYEKALAKYTQEMGQLKQRAEVATQQRITEQQINTRQTQQDVDQFFNTLGQFGQQMQNSSQQMMNSVLSRPAPQVNFGQQENNQVTCVNAGIVTSCRY